MGNITLSELTLSSILGGTGVFLFSYGVYDLFDSILEANTLKEIAYGSVDGPITPEIINQTSTLINNYFFNDTLVDLFSIGAGAAIVFFAYGLYQNFNK
ncbi:MAG: hypothetical protein KAJ20_01895 [Candidatus Aenigmarchaeota archaeon]|nr:hypothetical protein [Candidatus Aenigmarchaeota archaeon]MCK5062569.1 hypothetical protein [Candidatus Aenigmarchaeota archaeon]MCK5373063.1 hypothetical protein [Candidatus Aenigmarchaeota archaeon]